MSEESLVGREAAPYELHVELGKIREFARATLSNHPEYLASERPPSPVTFLATSRSWQEGDQSVWHGVDRDISRVLHGEQEFVFHGEPPRAGTRLSARERIESVFDKTGKRGGTMRFIVITTEYRDEQGTLVAEARMTQIITSAPPSGD
jgi:N-terminal half of MaoC dehydratase